MFVATVGVAVAGLIRPVFREHERRRVEHATHAVTQVRYRSQPFNLAAGDIVFTDPESTMMVMPAGRYAITGFLAEVADAQNVSVPLDRVYNHHWLVFSGKNNAGVCGGFLSFVFGMGAESRGRSSVFPDGNGLVVDGTEVWTANIHLIRTEGVANGSQGVKDCIECMYAPSKQAQNQYCVPENSGTFACCNNGVTCPTAQPTLPPVPFYLAYTVEYREDVNNVKAVNLAVLDASNCQIEYNVAENPTGIAVTRYAMMNPQDITVVQLFGHQHVGALNISISVDGQMLCTSVPNYGTQPGVAGNEKGYVVSMSTCEGRWAIKAGAQVVVTALYNVDPADTRLAIPGGAHSCVMALMYVVILV